MMLPAFLNQLVKNPAAKVQILSAHDPWEFQERAGRRKEAPIDRQAQLRPAIERPPVMADSAQVSRPRFLGRAFSTLWTATTASNFGDGVTMIAAAPHWPWVLPRWFPDTDAKFQAWAGNHLVTVNCGHLDMMAGIGG